MISTGWERDGGDPWGRPEEVPLGCLEPGPVFVGYLLTCFRTENLAVRHLIQKILRHQQLAGRIRGTGQSLNVLQCLGSGAWRVTGWHAASGSSIGRPAAQLAVKKHVRNHAVYQRWQASKVSVVHPTKRHFKGHCVVIAFVEDWWPVDSFQMAWEKLFKL